MELLNESQGSYRQSEQYTASYFSAHASLGNLGLTCKDMTVVCESTARAPQFHLDYHINLQLKSIIRERK